MIKRIRCGCIRVIFWTILLFALSISGLRYALSDLGFYKADIEAQLSTQLGAPVTIERIQGVLNGIKPELALHNIQVHAQQNGATTVRLKEIHLGLSLITAINHPLIEAIRISIIGANLSVTRLPSGGISIKGLPNSDEHEQPDWLMRGRRYALVDSEILWHDEKRNAEPVQLKHVNIVLHNDNEQHKIFFNADLPNTLGQSLQLAMSFTGNIFVPKSTNAQLFIEGKGIQLAEIVTGDLPFDFSFSRGQGDFSIWSKWQSEQMVQMSGSVHMNNGILKDSKNNQYPLDLLDLDFKLQKHQQQWHLAIKDSLFSANNNIVQIDELALAFAHNKQRELVHLAINSPQLTLGPVSKIIQHYKILPARLHKQLQTLALEGGMQDFLLLANPSQQTFAVNGQLHQIKTRPLDKIPGFDGLSAYIKGTEESGLIQISSQQLNITAPKLFREPLLFTQLLSELHWQHSDSWVLSTPLLELNTDHFKTSSHFSLTLPHKDQPALLSMQSAFDIPDVAQVPHFLPSGVINEETEFWLDHAFVAGTVNQGGALYEGALADFPFLEQQGVFEVLFAAKGFKLHYAPEWQDIQGLSAEVRFFADSLNINIHQGRANQVAIQQARVTIDSFNTSKYINIQGDIKSKLPEAVQFLTHTPFKDQVTAIDEQVDLQGSVDVNVDLKIPLTDQAIKANIKAKTKNASASIIPIDLAVSDITADFLFTEKGVFSKKLTASTLGFPVSAAVTTDNQAISAALFGQMSIAQLAIHFPNPFWKYLNGTSKYHLQVAFPHTSAQLSTIQLNTDLQGTAIAFPPFSKPGTETRPLYLKLGIDPAGLNAVNIAYENPQAPKSRVDIKLKKIAPDWQGLIHSPIASGSVFIPIEFNKETELSLALKHLNLSALKEIDLSNAETPVSIKNIPSINLSSQALYWNDYNLGSLVLQTHPATEGLSIKQCAISSSTNSLTLTGSWQQNNKQNSSSISGQFLSQNFGKILQQTQISNNIIDTVAELQFDLSWPAAPYALTRPIISGSMDSHLTNGRIIGVDPGLGRILGALDIWKLGKRLRLDFSDITDQGLSFSESTAHFTLINGLVSTQDFNINAMPATIEIDGFTNLATEEVNFRATVLPKIPIAGTIIGNVANAVSKTFAGNKQAGGLIASMLYEVDGTWEHFRVNRQYNSVLPPPPKL